MNRPRHALTRVAAALAVGALALVPEASSARPGQEGDPGEGSRDNGDAQVDVDIDVQRADELDIEMAFGDVRENVESQRAALEAAQGAVTAAEFALAVARDKVEETQTQIDALKLRADDVVVQAFVSPASETALDALTTSTPSEAAMKQALLDIQATSDADVLADLQDAQDELEERQEAEEAAAGEADRKRSEAEQALADLRGAVNQQVAFTAAVEDRLNANLAEADVLANIDPAQAERLRAEQANLAAQIASSRAALEQQELLEEAGVDPSTVSNDGPSQIVPVAGGVVRVTCPSGGDVEVAGEIAGEVQGLLNRAAEQGVNICGYGFRNPEEQVALRRAHCGSSHYAIYEAPASACSPPTAPPGSSMHERGLAIDFTSGGSTIGCGGAAYRYLDNNAADFGLYNLPSECWHWSTNGQ